MSRVKAYLCGSKDTPESDNNFRKKSKTRRFLKKQLLMLFFEKGVFDESESIKNWIIDLINNGAKKRTIYHYFIGCLKRICKGQIGDDVIEGWGLKHPDRLTLQDGKRYIYELRIRGKRTRKARLTLRSFLRSKGVVVRSSDINGKLEDDAGKYADLFVSRKKIYEILDWLKARNEDAYLSSKFAFKTATRITATLNAHASFINKEEHTIAVFEKTSNGKKERKMIKLIPDALWNELRPRIEHGRRLFRIKPSELNGFLRTAYKEIIPQVADRIPWPFHFWRHMFAQHMLRASDWNYGLVASLGGWSIEALKRYYGEPPKQVIRRFGLENLPKI